MTLLSLLSHDSPVNPNYNLPPLSGVDRTHWGGGGWKGGKGNPNAALSALTLLAFLFFLNILQSCLRDTIGQNNGMVVMMLPANATASTREKRELNNDRGNPNEDTNRGNCEEDSLKMQDHNWTDFDITDHVHTQVETYWSCKGNKADTTPFPSFQMKSKHLDNNILTVKKRISTKLTLNKERKDDTLQLDISKKTTPESMNINNKLNNTGLIPLANKNNQPDKGFWIQTISLVMTNSVSYMKKIFCCTNIACEEEKNVLSSNGSIYHLIRKTILWFCKSLRPAVVGSIHLQV